MGSFALILHLFPNYHLYMDSWQQPGTIGQTYALSSFRALLPAQCITRGIQTSENAEFFEMVFNKH